MEIIEVKFEHIWNVVITINWLLVIVAVIVSMLLYWIINLIYHAKVLKSIRIEEATIGVGNSTVVIKYDKRIQEIAYKIWVELNTRKIGIMFDEDNDVIIEVYNSWYQAFGVIRKLLEDVPIERVVDAEGLIGITTKVLNDGLRPHLTRWQARYRAWYNSKLKIDVDMIPQQLQREYPDYDELVKDLKRTNEIMIRFSQELQRIIYDK